MCLPLKPYRIEREWKHVGLSCSITQNQEAGYRCGYVRVPPNHPLFGKGYDEPAVDVHGGLTFAEAESCADHEDGRGWWFGFDCCHYDDLWIDPQVMTDDLPEPMRRIREINHKYQLPGGFSQHYWTQPEVEAETERLAEQLAI